MNIEKEREEEFIRKCGQLFEAYKKRIFVLRTAEEVTKCSNEFYKGLKEVAAYYYPGQEVPFNYRYLVDDMIRFEVFMPPSYICSWKRHDFSRVLDKPVSLKNEEAILNYLVDQTRNYLFSEVTIDREVFPFETYDLLNKCVKAADFLTECASSLGIESRRIVIFPCFKRNSGVMRGAAHAFSLVKINENIYLVDCTYSQFFASHRCNFNRIGVPLFAGTAAGSFMQFDSTHKEVALTILERGWMEYSNEMIKAYFDGFLLSYRNGLFYEHNKDFSFTADYTALDYINFIYGIDDLFLYEKKEELGFQLKPLRDPHLLIKHK